uniref:Activin_recp domain-containing protein n=1 Tax=Panagrellus redivivus TaxID=6233 RepID=A0A7E4VWJ8_PANRE
MNLINHLVLVLLMILFPLLASCYKALNRYDKTDEAILTMHLCFETEDCNEQRCFCAYPVMPSIKELGEDYKNMKLDVTTCHDALNNCRCIGFMCLCNFGCEVFNTGDH